MVNIFMVAAGFALVGVIGLAIYEFIIRKYFVQSKGQIVRLFVFEKIGTEFVFDHETTAEEKMDDELGAYFLTKKNKIPFDRLQNDDFFLDKKYGKCISLVKFSNDDYRPLIRLRNKSFFRLETTYRHKIDEKTGLGMMDDNDSPIMEPVEVHREYVEPLGISQNDREAFRFKFKYDKRMKEKYATDKGFWDKFSMPIMTVTMAIILMISFMYMTNTNSKTQIEIAQTFGDKADGIITAQNSPTFAQNLLDKFQQNKANEGAPPN